MPAPLMRKRQRSPPAAPVLPEREMLALMDAPARDLAPKLKEEVMASADSLQEALAAIETLSEHMEVEVEAHFF